MTIFTVLWLAMLSTGCPEVVVVTLNLYGQSKPGGKKHVFAVGVKIQQFDRILQDSLWMCKTQNTENIEPTFNVVISLCTSCHLPRLIDTRRRRRRRRRGRRRGRGRGRRGRGRGRGRKRRQLTTTTTTTTTTTRNNRRKRRRRGEGEEQQQKKKKKKEHNNKTTKEEMTINAYLHSRLAQLTPFEPLQHDVWVF